MEAPTIDELYKLAHYAGNAAMPGVNTIAKKTIAWAYALAEIDQHPLQKARLAIDTLKEAELPIEPMLCLSTSHVSMKTAKALTEDTLPIHRYEHGNHGWLFAVSSDLDIANADMPSDLRDALMYSRELNCDWLMLDQDGTIVPSLETYEW